MCQSGIGSRDRAKRVRRIGRSRVGILKHAAAAAWAPCGCRSGGRVNPLPLAIAELRRNPLGCAAIVALIALTVALGVAVTAQERALRQASTRAADRFDLIVGAPGSPTQLVLTTVYLQPAALELLPEDTLAQLSQEPGVAAIAPVAVTDSYRGYAIVGTTAAFAGGSGMVDGRMFAGAHEAVIGSAVQLPLGQTLLPAHGSPAENMLETREHNFDVTIVGRVSPTGTAWDRAIMIPIEAVWAIHDDEHGRETKRVPARGAAIADRAAGLRQPLAAARLSISVASISSGNDLSTAPMRR